MLAVDLVVGVVRFYSQVDPYVLDTNASRARVVVIGKVKYLLSSSALVVINAKEKVGGNDNKLTSSRARQCTTGRRIIAH